MSDTERTPLLKDPWRSMTLPGLARGAALLRPERPALADSANAASLLGRPARTLCTADLEREATLLARKLAALGLKRGERVLVQLPNTIEAAIGVLGVLAAGGVPAVTPVFTTEPELAARVDMVGAAGILTVARFAGAALASTARTVAAACDSIRFVAAFGERAPDGVAALDSWKTVEFFGEKPENMPLLGTDDALLSFDTVGGSLRAFLRTHEQLIVEAAAAAALAQIGADSRMLVTLPPASLAGVTFGLVAPMLTGAAAELTALFDGCAFAQTLGDGKRLAVVLPAAAEEAFHAHCASRKIRAETLVFVHRPAANQATMAGVSPGQAADRTLDCIALGEACGWMARRSAAGAAARHAIADMFAEPAQPLELTPDAGRLMAAGPLVPTLLGSGERVIETGFRPSLLAPPPAPARSGRSRRGTAAA